MDLTITVATPDDTTSSGTDLAFLLRETADLAEKYGPQALAEYFSTIGGVRLATHHN